MSKATERVCVDARCGMYGRSDCCLHQPTAPRDPYVRETRTEAQLDAAIAAVKSYRETVARTEIEQAVLDTAKGLDEHWLRYVGRVGIPSVHAFVTAVFALRGMK